MNTTRFLTKSILISLAGMNILFPSAGCQSVPPNKSIDQPNVVLIVSDDHGTNDAGCYGNQVIKTPNMDYLASQGILFTNAFCTSASCSASRSVILTGIYNHANGQYGHQHSYHHFKCFENIKSLPAFLSEAGYTTCRIGKYHVAPEKVFPFDMVLKDKGRNTVTMAEETRDFINKHKDKPFFLYFCTYDPHRSGGYAEEPYKPNLFGNRKDGYPGINPVRYDPGEVIVPSYLPDTKECRAELAQYYQSVSRVDQGMGRLFKILKEAGVWQHTIIIYISDNGIAFPGAKTNLYDPSMRLPCIVKLPHSKFINTVSDAMVTWADLSPTILDLCDAIPKKYSFQGRSFKEVFGQKKANGWDTIYASHTFHEITMYYPMRVIQTRKYKLIWNIASGLDYPHASDLLASPTWQKAISQPEKPYGKRKIADYLKRPAFELYDLQNDPDEIDNLAYKPGYSGVLNKLKVKIKAFQKRTKDPWVTKWEYE